MKMYTVKDVSEILALGVITIRSMIKDQDLRAYKVGREWRIKEEDLMEFIERKSNMEG